MNTVLAELPRRAGYLALAAGLITSQHLVAWMAGSMSMYPPAGPPDLEFWLTPLRSALGLRGLSDLGAAALFACSLLVAWALAVLSFRRADRTNWGYALAVLSVVPVIQIGAILFLALLPAGSPPEASGERRDRETRGVVYGLLAGISIIVLAVLVSAVTFGAYGWGLFVMTPFLVGLTTGYLVNRDSDLGGSGTMTLVISAAGLGSLALVVLALEGVLCILMAAPLAIPVTMIGGAIGRRVALARLSRRNPLVSVAMLPMIFMLEAAVPPEAPIATSREIEIAARPGKVWAALTSAEPIRIEPGLTAAAGLAYPISGRLEGEGMGATRIGKFSTGLAREEVTEWKVGRTLAFRVLSQPAAMEEMSPYRRVHAPHVVGYFETGETRFDLSPLPEGRTRLRITAEHHLRIDPAPYWEPIARLAIRENVDRVLEDIREKALRN
jgi:hypothetical protein